jgi:plastocyanin
MSRTFRIALAVAAAVIATVVAAPGQASAPKTVKGTVGPGFTIRLTMGGKKVTNLKKGVPYRFMISDRSSIHDYHLVGPGLNRMLTTVGFAGTKSFVLRLKKGSYRFFCDPHSAEMHGSFRVV